jgi:hypothetical protein
MGDKGECIVKVETGGPRTYDTGFPSVRAHSLTRPFVALNFKTTCSGGIMVLALFRGSNARRYNATAGLSRVLQC